MTIRAAVAGGALIGAGLVLAGARPAAVLATTALLLGLGYAVVRLARGWRS